MDAFLILFSHKGKKEKKVLEVISDHIFSVLVMNVSKLMISALISIFSYENSIQVMVVKLCDFPDNYQKTFWCIHIF